VKNHQNRFHHWHLFGKYVADTAENMAFKTHHQRTKTLFSEFGKYFRRCYTYGQSVGNDQVANICPNALFP